MKEGGQREACSIFDPPRPMKQILRMVKTLKVAPTDTVQAVVENVIAKFAIVEKALVGRRPEEFILKIDKFEHFPPKQ